MKKELPDHDCSQFLKKVNLYLDGELTHQEEAVFLADIDRCSYCFEHYEIEKSFKTVLCQKIKRKHMDPELKRILKEKISIVISSS